MNIDPQPLNTQNSSDPIRWDHKGPSAGGLFFALVLILGGSLLLLNNFGVISWATWNVIWRAWPVFLVLAGLQVILGRSGWARIVVGLTGVVLLVGVLVYAIAVTNSSLNDWLNNEIPAWRSVPGLSAIDRLTNDEIVIPQDKYANVKSRLVRLDLGSEKLTMRDNSSTDFAVVKASYFGKNNQIEVEQKLTAASELEVNVSTMGSTGFSLGNWGETQVEMTIGQPSLPTRLAFDLGSGQSEVNLSLLKNDRIQLNLGSGELDLTLGAAALPSDRLVADVGSGSLNINLPKNTGVKIQADIGSGNLEVNGKSVTDGVDYMTDNYNSAANKVTLQVDLGSGNVEIKTER